jgi:hypothetical protein
MKKLIALALLLTAAALLAAFTAGRPGEGPGEGTVIEPAGSTDSSKARSGQPGEAVAEEAVPEEAVPQYVGARKCKVCHLDIYKSWEETKHAWALSALDGDQLQDPKCLACHTTGFGRGGYGAETGLANLSGIQCEVCHGAGSLYSRSSVMRERELSVEMGLVLVDSTTCVACHNSESPTFKGFAYEAGLSTGTHSRKRN